MRNPRRLTHTVSRHRGYTSRSLAYPQKCRAGPLWKPEAGDLQPPVKLFALSSKEEARVPRTGQVGEMTIEKPPRKTVTLQATPPRRSVIGFGSDRWHRPADQYPENGDSERHHPGERQDQPRFMFRELGLEFREISLKLREIGFRRNTARYTRPYCFRDRFSLIGTETTLGLKLAGHDQKYQRRLLPWWDLMIVVCCFNLSLQPLWVNKVVTERVRRDNMVARRVHPRWIQHDGAAPC